MLPKIKIIMVDNAMKKKCLCFLCAAILIIMSCCLTSCFEEECVLCDSTGLLLCGDCHASGCRKCDGERKWCRKCGGDGGFIIDKGTQVPPEYKYCGACYGLKVELNTTACYKHDICSSCNGTGKIDCTSCEIVPASPPPVKIFND